VDLGRPSQTLPGAAQVALSPNQPNPFSTETAFTLQLHEAADVAVGIYDLRGRAVANLHRAPLTPGPHVFRWDGRGSDGRSAPNGIYFYQATVGGKSLARKLILMRGN
jgi:flagellar hook assembly protein FlgD